MISQEENDRLTRVGPGTPAGDLLRRYWHPVAALSDLETNDVLPVRLLGEDLALFRMPSGQLGLVQDRCPHRGTSLSGGWPDETGLRCPYHGWCFEPAGHCVAMPYDDVRGSSFKDRIRVTAYPVDTMGGLVWAYLGPQPVPRLPPWDLFVDADLVRQIGQTVLPCNWLQCMENSLDPVHFEWLHARQLDYLTRRAGEQPILQPRRHLRVGAYEFEYGLFKTRLLEGDPEDSQDWTVGHPVIFPNMLRVSWIFQIRVPIDDTHTLHFNYSTRRRHDDEPPQESVPRVDVPYLTPDGEFIRDVVLAQDFAAWIRQGPIAPRDEEHLCRSDVGIIAYRRMLSENIERVARDEDPIGVIRDPSIDVLQVEVEHEIGILKGAHNYQRGDVTKRLLNQST